MIREISHLSILRKKHYILRKKAAEELRSWVSKLSQEGAVGGVNGVWGRTRTQVFYGICKDVIILI